MPNRVHGAGSGRAARTTATIESATFGRARSAESWLTRRDPAIKLVALLILSMAMTGITDPVTPTLGYTLILTVALTIAKIKLRTALIAHVPFAFFALSLFVANTFTRHGHEVATLGPVTITREGLLIGGGLAMRTFLVGLATMVFIHTTDGAKLMTSLHANFHLSGRFAYAVLSGYRLLEQLPQTWSTIRQAQAMRQRCTARRPAAGGRTRTITASQSPRALTHAMFALLVTSLRRGERMAISMETRALGSVKRTIARPHPITGQDWILLAGLVAGLVSVVLLSAWWGTLRGLGQLHIFG